MANVKNFGLFGVGTTVQFGKSGPSIGQQSTTILAATGTAAFKVPAGTTAQQPLAATAGAGGVRYNSDLSAMEYSNGTTWTTLSTGGAAVTAISIVSANGFTGSSSGGTTPALTIATSITGILKGNGTAISAAVSGTDLKTVGGLTIIGSGDAGTITVPYGGTGAITLTGYVKGNAAAAMTASTTIPVTDLTGTLLAGQGGTGVSTFSSGDVLYASAANTWSAGAKGTTSGVQAWDSGLDALAAKSSTGILVQIAANTYSSVSLTQPAAGITISNSDGVAGSPTFALANDLAAVEGLATTGYAVRTATDTWTTRTFTGSASNITITNGDGVAGATNIDLFTVTQAGTGNFVKVTLDTKGRVTGNTAVVAADITALVDSTYVNVSGDTMIGDLNMGTNFVTMTNPPTTGTQAANKAYVDSVAAGLSWKDPVRAASTANISGTYNNGASGVGATIAAGGTTITIDGVALANADRLLVKNQTTTANNGIYLVSGVGSSVVLTRTVNMDAPGEFYGAAVLVTAGTTNINTGWTQTEVVATVGTDPVLWIQFSGSNTYVWGAGLSNSGNTVNVNMGAGIIQLPSDEVGIDVASGKAVQLTGSLTGDQLTFVLDGAGITSGLSQSASGLKIAATGVTNAMLTNQAITMNADSGTPDAVNLGETFLIAGTSGQGISTAVTANTVTVTASNASSVQKGVASFTTTEFVVTAGNVALGLVGPTKGGTGFSAYTVGDILYADTTSSLAKLAIGATGTVLKGGTTPSYSAVSLTADVSGILPGTNGGTGVNNSTRTITIAGNLATVGAFASTFTMTNTTTVTFPTTGTLATTANTVASFSAGTTGFTPSSATTGAVTLAGTLIVGNGGTGVATLGSTQVMIGNGTGNVITGAGLTFASEILTVGTTSPLTVNGSTATIASSTTNANINLVPNGTGAVVVGSAAAGIIRSNTALALTVDGRTGLTLQASTSGGVTVTLTGTTANKVVISGPTPAQYATSMTDATLVNKYYVDQTAGVLAGDIKAVQSVVSLSGVGTTNIGAVLPAGVTILSVKVSVTAIDTATGTLSVGKSGSVSAYMTTSENDTQTAGLYLAETYVDEAGAVQVIATVAGTPGGAGSAKVLVTYQIN